MAFVSWARASKKPTFLKAAKAAHFRSETQMKAQSIKEAKGNHTWAKYSPSAPHVDGNIKIDIAAARTAKLALS